MDLKTLVTNLRKDADELEQLDRLIRGIKGFSRPTAAHSTNGKRTMSAAARKRIAAAQKARWAKVKAQKKG